VEHPLRSIDRFVDLGGVRCELAPAYSTIGIGHASGMIWQAAERQNRRRHLSTTRFGQMPRTLTAVPVIGGIQLAHDANRSAAPQH
jgi:hypothetical protein